MILDTIIILELAVVIYLLWQFIPVERQKEEIRKVKKKLNIKPKSRLIEWTAPEAPATKGSSLLLTLASSLQINAVLHDQEKRVRT